MLQELSMLTAGAQPWHHNISTTHNNRFAYAATLVIYVYQVFHDNPLILMNQNLMHEVITNLFISLNN